MDHLFSPLRPTEEEIRRLARKETDPRFYADFTPITGGFLFAILALALLGLIAAVCIPFWLLRPRRNSR